MDRAFVPGGAPVDWTVSSTSQPKLLSAGRGLKQVRMANANSAAVWVRCGGSTIDVTATAGQANTGMMIPAGVVEVLTFNPGDDGLYMAVIAPTGTGNFQATPGSGA